MDGRRRTIEEIFKSVRALCRYIGCPDSIVRVKIVLNHKIRALIDGSAMECGIDLRWCSMTG